MAQVLRVRLQETPTLLLYQQENTSVCTADPDAQQYITEWESYIQKRDAQQVKTREVTCQTVLKYYVDKTSQKSAVERKDTGSWATQWDMHDEYEKLKARAKPPKPSGGGQRRRSQSTLQYYTGDAASHKANLGVELSGLLRGLGSVERQLSTTNNLLLIHSFASGQHQVRERRKVSMSSGRASIHLLWQYISDRTRGSRVNAITFCKTSPWLVMATYGTPSFTSQAEGLLVGWNVKKIKQPELRLSMPLPATVLCSCPSAPQLCCVALLDGTLLVYQLDTPKPQLILDTSGSVDKHSMPVWAVEWRDSQIVSSTATKRTLSPAGERPPSFRRLVIDLKGPPISGSEIAYVLVSSSEDGTVKEWIFIKGSLLCCTTLLNVRLPLWLSVRISGGIENLVGPRQERESLGGLPLPQKIPTTSLHFRPGDKTTYLVGTTAGEVLLEVSGGYVDACWCPWYGNLIAGVHGSGLHLWDISLSTHTPIISHSIPGATCVAFSPHTRNVMVGDREGRVNVFHMEGLDLCANVFLKYSTKISKLAKIGVIPVE